MHLGASIPTQEWSFTLSVGRAVGGDHLLETEFRNNIGAEKFCFIYVISQQYALSILQQT